MITLLPGHKAYEPRGGAKDLFYCRNKEILFEGPAGTGKTRAALEKALFCAMKWDGSRILLVRATRVSMTQSVLVTFEEKVLSGNLLSICSGAGRENRQSYHLPNGSEIVVGGMDKPDRIMSTEYDLIIYFEATEGTEDGIEKLTTRLRNWVMPFQQLICDCNPGAPTHFLNQRANAGKMTRILSRHSDNPSVKQEYLNTLSQLSGARKLRLYEGKWASQEGLVYDFDQTIHLIDRFDIPKEWKRYRVIDFGYTNPFVCQWWAESPDDILYRYREIYHTKRIVSDHAKQIISLSEGESFVENIADHDAEDRATLHSAGIYTEAAIKDITTGIQAVEERLRVKPNGKAGMYFLRDSLVERDQSLVEAKKPTCTEEEFDSYAYPKTQEGKTNKEAPIKNDDHGMDTTRYLAKHKTIGVKKAGRFSSR